MFVTIGGKYATLLGYQEAVGAMGVISKAMNALVEVQVLTGSAVGKSLDIHKDDITEQAKEPLADIRYFLSDFEDKKIYHTSDKSMFDYVVRIKKGDVKVYETTIDEIMRYNTSIYKDYTIHSLDDEYDKSSKHLRDGYALSMKLREQMKQKSE